MRHLQNGNGLWLILIMTASLALACKSSKEGAASMESNSTKPVLILVHLPEEIDGVSFFKRVRRNPQEVHQTSGAWAKHHAMRAEIET